MHHLPEVVARSIALCEASAHLRGRAALLMQHATGARAAVALATRRTRVRRVSGGADGPVPVTTPVSVALACPRCAERIDAIDPVVTLESGDLVHVRCWRPPDPGHAPVLSFAESPMPPLESFRSRPGRPGKRQSNGGPAPHLH